MEGLNALVCVGEAGAWLFAHGINTVLQSHYLICAQRTDLCLGKDVAVGIFQLNAVPSGRGEGKAGGFLADKQHQIFTACKGDPL